MRAGAERSSTPHEHARQQVAGEVVDRKAQLVAVAALHTPVIAGVGRADAGVIDEHVESLELAGESLTEPAHLLQRGEVGAQPAQPRVSRGLFDARQRLVPPALVAAVQEHRRARRGELGGERPPETVGGAGDQNRLLVECPHGERVCQAAQSVRTGGVGCWRAVTKEHTR